MWSIENWKFGKLEIRKFEFLKNKTRLLDTKGQNTVIDPRGFRKIIVAYIIKKYGKF